MGERMIRRCKRSQSGWDAGDMDVAFQLFSCGMVWDGNLSSKSSRDHLVAHGFAVRHEGMQSLTGRGIVHFITTPAVWASAWRSWRFIRRNPFVATADQIKRAMK